MSLKVLTVDDSKTIRMIVKKAFKPYDCELMEAENGVEGLAAAAKEKPDLIVLDITMPVMNGIEMLEKLKNEPGLKEIPVIMLTAESGKENVMQIVKMGVKDYIVKPFKGEQLIERAQNIVKLESKKAENSASGEIEKCFSLDGDIQILALPEDIVKTSVVQFDGYLQLKTKEMLKAGIKKLILDLSKMNKVNMSSIELIGQAIQSCLKSNIGVRIAGSSSLGSELKGFQETSEIPFDTSVAVAKAAI